MLDAYQRRVLEEACQDASFEQLRKKYGRRLREDELFERWLLDEFKTHGVGTADDVMLRFTTAGAKTLIDGLVRSGKLKRSDDKWLESLRRKERRGGRQAQQDLFDAEDDLAEERAKRFPDDPDSKQYLPDTFYKGVKHAR